MSIFLAEYAAKISCDKVLYAKKIAMCQFLLTFFLAV
jgi:hypothetical protein